MTIWIVTTGNSDVQLKNNDNWEKLYEEVRSQSPLKDCDNFYQVEQDKKTKLFTAPARVLGLVYGNQPEAQESDLKFPLLETYCQYFTNQIDFPNKIIVLITDQAKIFSEDHITSERCPYWQDTCTLEPILENYFQNNFGVKPLFLPLQPEDGQGLDHWNETLSLVETTLDDAQRQLNLDVNSDETVYVSHQAGTPAISSAVQFVSLGKFKKVEFLVSNQYYDENYEQQSEPEAIKSSKYWQGMQIQKAKKLITDGLPGAALELLKGIDSNAKYLELEKLVEFFNIKSSVTKGDEFEIKPATQRIVDALDLIKIFFKQKNYIQGIAILAAAQETFLKVAIFHQVQLNDQIIKNVKVSQLVEWDDSGLFLKPQSNFRGLMVLRRGDDFQQIINQSLNSINFSIPVDDDPDFKFWKTYSTQDWKQFSLKNHRLFKWLRKLPGEWTSWAMLEWICQYKREYENDLRNQLMHNLVGVVETEVIQYLLGYKDAPGHTDDVSTTYEKMVKEPFMKALNDLDLPYKENNLQKKLQEVADTIH